MQQYLLMIQGQDEEGLINKITGCLYFQGLNIISNHEFVDTDTNRFFMRSEFTGNMNEETLMTALHKQLPDNFEIEIRPQRKKQIIVFATKEHHCLADLLIREAYGNLNAEILAIISNFESLKPLVEKFEKPFYYVPHQNLDRSAHEDQIHKVLGKFSFDYLVLAKYMRILTPEFVDRYENQIVNIHHSFLPAFIGVNPYEQAFTRGVKIMGATAHFVNHNLDEGPILVQEVTHIDHKFSIEDMIQAGRDVEVMALSKALKYVFEDRVFINGNKTVIFT